MIHVYNMLPPAVVKNINDFYEFCDFTDGSWSGSSNRELKYNEQILDEIHYPSLVEIVNKQLSENKEFNYYFLPRGHTHPNFLRYKEGMHYAWHNDMWILDGMKTDYSVTCFLSSPDDYDGGELVIEVGGKELEYKLKPGQAVIYQTGLPHYVKKVTKGERRVITWWFCSMIDNGKNREIIMEFSKLLAQLEPDHPLKHKFETIRHNLIRENAII